MTKRRIVRNITCPGRYGSPEGPYVCASCSREIEAGEKYTAVGGTRIQFEEDGTISGGEGGGSYCCSCIDSNDSDDEILFLAAVAAALKAMGREVRRAAESRVTLSRESQEAVIARLQAEIENLRGRRNG